MGVVDFAQYVNEVIQAGEIVEGNVVRIVADNGAEIGNAVFKEIQGGNGVASNVAVATQTASGGAMATGLAYLSLDIGTAGAAIAPALGILAGVGLYSLSPSFWDGVANALVNAGKTLNGKLIAYWDGNNLHIDGETIEIFKNKLLEAGMFEIKTSENPFDIPTFDTGYRYEPFTDRPPINILLTTDEVIEGNLLVSGYSHITYFLNDDTFPQRGSLSYVVSSTTQVSATDESFTYDGKTVYYRFGSWLAWSWYSVVGYSVLTNFARDLDAISEDNRKYMAWLMEYGTPSGNATENLQDDAQYPNENPFPLTYPDWYPLQYDPLLPSTPELPDVYPLKYPEIDPNGLPKQDQAQEPDPEEYPEIYPVILPDFDFDLDRYIDPYHPELPDPDLPEDPDPDDSDDPDDELPEEPEPITPEDPIDPNTEPDDNYSPVIPDVTLPDAVNSSKLFTVYNPTGAQLDALGGYLWDSSLMASLRDIWQDPLDGIISLIQVYVTPQSGGAHNIILGFLDSGVSANVVTSQFVTVDCGSVQIKENKKNATDYAPYTSLHLFLPFIGIVELDTTECMKSTINVKYKVDVYTGTCLATVSVTRAKDMPNSPILYTYSGNCAQQLPLTSGNATGLFSALLGGVTSGLAVASGGGLGVVAGAQMVGNSLSHEMFHVAHSGNISANAGIMGNKKPYLIIGRRHSYDANDYCAFYGYPSNKTVILNNQSGYVKVKKCLLKTKATAPENEEIMSLLTSGVIL